MHGDHRQHGRSRYERKREADVDRVDSRHPASRGAAAGAAPHGPRARHRRGDDEVWDQLTLEAIAELRAAVATRIPEPRDRPPDARHEVRDEEVRQRSAFWRANLERLSAADDPLVARLAGVGLSPSRLEGLYDELVANPDVHFPAEAVDPPSDAAVEQGRGELDRLLNRGSRLLPTEPDEKGWDNLQTRLRLLLFLRRVVSWGDRTEFLDVLAEEFYGRSYDVVQKRWPEGARAKALSEEWGALRDGATADLLDRWWAHRYPIALAFARRTAEAYQAERVRFIFHRFTEIGVASHPEGHPQVDDETGVQKGADVVDEDHVERCRKCLLGGHDPPAHRAPTVVEQETVETVAPVPR